MTLRIIITKGRFKGRKARVAGVYMDGRVDVKIGHKYYVLPKGYTKYLD